MQEDTQEIKDVLPDVLQEVSPEDIREIKTVSSDIDESWTCNICTVINDANTECSCCGSPKPNAVIDYNNYFNCYNCGKLNPKGRTYCMFCNKGKPPNLNLVNVMVDLMSAINEEQKVDVEQKMDNMRNMTVVEQKQEIHNILIGCPNALCTCSRSLFMKEFIEQYATDDMKIWIEEHRQEIIQNLNNNNIERGIQYSEEWVSEPLSEKGKKCLVEMKTNETETLEDRCTICLDDLKNDNCSKLPCEHIFHKDCIDGWLEQRPNCPICKTVIKSDSEMKIDKINEELNSKRKEIIDVNNTLIDEKRKEISKKLSMLEKELGTFIVEIEKKEVNEIKKLEEERQERISKC